MQVTICGLTNLQDAEVASKAGADYMGFVINYPKSPRSNEYIKICNIIYNIRLNNENVKSVGVFVDQPIDMVKRMAIECQFDVIQLHGNESIEYCKELKKNFEVWKAIILKTKRDLNKIEKYKKTVDKILLDSGKGSGKEINIELLKQVKKIDIIAGGIGLDNINEIIKLKPGIIDVNSKIETKPGIKDHKKMKQIIKIIKSCV